MRAWPIELTKDEFDRYFHKYVSNICSKDEAEHLVSLRLLEKIQDPVVTVRVNPVQSKIDEAEESGELWWPSYRLAADSHTFWFDEDEKRLAEKRLENNLGRIPPVLGHEYEALRQKLIGAEPVDLTPPSDDEPGDEEESAAAAD